MVAVGDLLQVDKPRNAGTVAPRRDLLSLAFIVSDSLDPSARAVRNSVTALKGAYRRATVLQRDFGYQQVGFFLLRVESRGWTEMQHGGRAPRRLPPRAGVAARLCEIRVVRSSATRSMAFGAVLPLHGMCWGVALGASRRVLTFLLPFRSAVAVAHSAQYAYL